MTRGAAVLAAEAGPAGRRLELAVAGLRRPTPQAASSCRTSACRSAVAELGIRDPNIMPGCAGPSDLKVLRPAHSFPSRGSESELHVRY